MVELIGKIKDLVISRSGEALLTFVLKTDLGALESEVSNLSSKDISLKFGAYTPKRSLNANAYFHTLCREIAKKVERSETFVKNKMIASYGQFFLMDNGDRAVIKSNLDLNKMWEQETLHVKPLKATIENGKEINFYAVMRPTHEYTVEEMSLLINGTVEEAKEMGVPTIGEKEVEKLLNAWESHYGINHQQ